MGENISPHLRRCFVMHDSPSLLLSKLLSLPIVSQTTKFAAQKTFHL